MMSIRIHLGLVIFSIFLISCNTCDSFCLDGGNDTTLQIQVPFKVSPQKEVYRIGDTITLSLFMDEYYSISTNESIPIKENLIKNYKFSFLDTVGYRQASHPLFSIDSFNFIIDTNARKFYSSTGESNILFKGIFDKNSETIQFTAKFIPRSTGFYVLQIAWGPSITSTTLIDLTDDCGKEYYTLESIINQGDRSTRNVHLVENDSTLLRQSLDGFLSDLTIDSILNIPYNYYFYVEE